LSANGYSPTAIGRAIGLLTLGISARAGGQTPLPEITLHPGLVITRSVRVTPGTYRLTAPSSLDSAAIVIRGDGITVDFGGATLRGAPVEALPDHGAGVAIRIEGGRNITVRNATIRGYKIGILARDVRGLRLIGNDASHNWKPRLYSLIEHESLADWLSYHQNDKDEWYRYGAAIYLSGVRGGEIRGNTVVQGMNGLLVTRSDSLRVLGNTFSFNSGLGIGLYRSRDNLIANNRLEFNVRGYSHGFYRRGQDSAALLLYEQSHRNVVAWNAATHGGDGLFLWAGQTTMDSGAGGANDNVFFANDFSWAPTNAMEATFSRNSFLANRAVGSEYGLWGGYSFESKIIGNCFGKNRFGVAIEHGQDNLIAANRFNADSLAIRLWGDSIQPSDWGYPKHRDTRSRDYRIEENVFGGNKLTVQAVNTTGLALRANDSTADIRDRCIPGVLPAEYRAMVPAIPGARAEIPASVFANRDRSAMIVDAWGPFDWKSPKLWPVDSSRAVPLRLAVLGPAGRWRVTERRGISALSKLSGKIGDTLTVTPSDPGDWRVTLEYSGGATVSPRGERRAAGARSRFGFERFEPAVEWNLRFFAWKDSSDLAAFTRSAPILERKSPRLDYQWYRPLVTGLPRDKWALEATTRVTLAPGEYTLRTISDDGIRVYVDGVLRIDRWSVHESIVDTIPIPSGEHDVRVEFFQAEGWTELRVEIHRQSLRLQTPAPSGGD